MEQKQATDTFWQFDSSYWFGQLNSSENGLSQDQALERMKKSGGSKKPSSDFKMDLTLFFSQFKSPLMLLLLGAVILSAFIGETADVFIILFILIVAGLLSFFQERNAGRVVKKLQSMIAIKSTVMRDGLAKEIITSEIVPGDVLIFNAGDFVPSDCLVLEANELYANEASLSGESFPVKKSVGILDGQTVLSLRTNSLWEGTHIVSGNAKALVIRTGEKSIFGGIAKSASASVETSFEKGLKDFGFFLMKITLVLSIFILVVNLLNQKNVMESALFALALAVGMAPELLPAITTISMSAGAKRLLAKKVIVKKLSSITNLGGVDLLCTDKTGTITTGEIKVVGMVNPFGEESDFVKMLAFWNATFEAGYSNPIDEALKKIEYNTTEFPTKIGEVPYDFIRKRLSVAIQTESEKLLITKGAFSQVMGICSSVKMDDGSVSKIDGYRLEIEKRFEAYGEKGFRVIGICFQKIENPSISKEDEKEMVFAGFILLQDAVKEGLTATIEELKKLGVSLKIITGDNQNVARSVALNIGIKNPVVMTGAALMKISSEALSHRVNKTHIFAEVEPHQKERIIQSLRKTHTVAYMGDGINDVSAITAADVGISVENAVDITRAAADFVLTEKDLSVLVEGIKEGRRTFANTLKYIYISTGSTFGNMISVAAASLVLPFLPMLPKQILLTNLISDFPFISVTTDNVDEEQLAKPLKWNLTLIRRYMLVFGIHSSFFDLLTFFTLLFLLKARESEFQTGWFIVSALSELFILFIIRTHKNFYKSNPGKYLLGLSLAGMIVTISFPFLPFAGEVGMVPLPILYLVAMFTIVIFYAFTADILKVWFFKKYRNR